MSPNDPTKEMRKKRREKRLVASAVALLFCCLFPCSTQAGSQAAFSGITEAYHDVFLGISAPGRIDKIHYREGQKVAAGAVILQLDQQAEELEVERRKLLWESKAEVTSAANQVKTLEAHLKTTKELYASTGSVNREEMENQELELTLAQSELVRLETNELREELEYSIALEQLKKRSLCAPFSGVIAELLADVGETFERDKPMVHFVDTSRCYLDCNVELPSIGILKLGQTVALQLQAGDDPVSLQGKIVFISPVVDPASGLRKVKALFDNKDGKVVPGVTGVMSLTIQ